MPLRARDYGIRVGDCMLIPWELEYTCKQLGQADVTGSQLPLRVKADS
jgi:hypothetical protein